YLSVSHFCILLCKEFALISCINIEKINAQITLNRTCKFILFSSCYSSDKYRVHRLRSYCSKRDAALSAYCSAKNLCSTLNICDSGKPLFNSLEEFLICLLHHKNALDVLFHCFK